MNNMVDSWFFTHVNRSILNILNPQIFSILFGHPNKPLFHSNPTNRIAGIKNEKLMYIIRTSYWSHRFVSIAGAARGILSLRFTLAVSSSSRPSSNLVTKSAWEGNHKSIICKKHTIIIQKSMTEIYSYPCNASFN